MANFSFRRLAGWACGTVAMLIIAVLLGGSVTLSGVAVPNDLGDFVKVAEAQGDAYKAPPEGLDATCVLKSEVSPTTLENIKKVSQAEPQQCDFATDDALWLDTLWGAVAALLTIVVLVGVIWLARNTITMNWLVLVGLLVGAFVLGGLLWSQAGGWLEDLGIEAPLFWRGYGAMLAFGLGVVGAHEAHRSMGHN